MDNQISVFISGNFLFWNTDFGNYKLYFNQTLFSEFCDFYQEDICLHETKFYRDRIDNLNTSKVLLSLEQIDQQSIEINNVFYLQVKGTIWITNHRISHLEVEARRLNDSRQSFSPSAKTKYSQIITPYLNQTENLLTDFITSNQKYYSNKLKNYLLTSATNLQKCLQILD